MRRGRRMLLRSRPRCRGCVLLRSGAFNWRCMLHRRWALGRSRMLLGRGTFNRSRMLLNRRPLDRCCVLLGGGTFDRSRMLLRRRAFNWRCVLLGCRALSWLGARSRRSMFGRGHMRCGSRVGNRSCVGCRRRMRRNLRLGSSAWCRPGFGLRRRRCSVSCRRTVGLNGGLFCGILPGLGCRLCTRPSGHRTRSLLRSHGSGGNHVLWAPAIGFGIGSFVYAGSGEMLCLHCGGSHMALVRSDLF